MGCEKEDIRRYQAPHSESIASSEEQSPVRLLAAIIPHQSRTWFVKLSGPATAVDEHKGAFEKFVESIRFTNQAANPVTWTAPEDWRQEHGSALRYATFRVPAKGHTLELTVVALGAEAGELLPNINRWRGQIGLKPVAEKDVASVTREIKIDDATATLVDMTGPGGGEGGMGAPFAGGRGAMPPRTGESASTPIHYDTPSGWTLRPAGAMSVATLSATRGADSAEITVTPFAGAAGGLLSNVNRWRGQLHLAPVTEEQLRKEIREISVAGGPAQYVDLLGAENGGPRERILGVITSHGGQTWFFKMKGPAELVGNEKPSFEAFVKSVRFGEGEGGKQ
jgi:hypothetical protein